MIAFKKILIATDFSAGSARALSLALELAARSRAEVHVVHAMVLYGDAYAPPEFPVSKEEQIHEMLVEFVAQHRDEDVRWKGLQIEYSVLRDVAAAAAILNYADRSEIDLIVTGTHGRRGFRRMILGSVAEELVRMAECPVLSVSEHEETRTNLRAERVLVPIDFSSNARAALSLARELASDYEARIDLLHVIEESLHPAFYNTGVFSIYDTQPDIEGTSRDHLKRFASDTPGPNVEMTYNALPGLAAREIIQFAKAKASDLIVMSTHGLTGLAHVLIGSVAERVVRTAPCPVLTTKTMRETNSPSQGTGAGNSTRAG